MMGQHKVELGIGFGAMHLPKLQYYFTQWWDQDFLFGRLNYGKFKTHSYTINYINLNFLIKEYVISYKYILNKIINFNI